MNQIRSADHAGVDVRRSSLAARFDPRLSVLFSFLSAILLASCSDGSSAVASDDDPPEVVLGERLFLETRFSQFFADFAGGNSNAALPAGDPALDDTVTPTGPLPGPFAGSSMNCRACHLVDEHGETPGGGVRTYADFAERSPVPIRPDGRTVTVRNSPSLVNASVARENFLLHFDGEFDSVESLVVGTLTGRNFGWLPDERAAAIAHIARIIREDDGTGDLAVEFGGFSYRAMFLPALSGVPAAMQIPSTQWLDVMNATDAQVVAAVAGLISAYVSQLEFARDENGEFSGSPFDLFLSVNSLPRRPDEGESNLDYSRRLRDLVDGLQTPVFVTPTDGEFSFHAQDFAFGQDELDGLRIFLREPSAIPAVGGVGNCIACHHLPEFTDFGLHNIGITQAEYDTIHGGGSFALLAIPNLSQRQATPEMFLPASAANPMAPGPFLSVPNVSQPMLTDLGTWNVALNPAVPTPQARIRTLIESALGGAPASLTDEALLAASIATFKTPGLRDLGQSAPYMHNGRFDMLSQVIQHYVTFSAQARSSLVRNADPQLEAINLTVGDIAPLVAFLRALNEDYD